MSTKCDVCGKRPRVNGMTWCRECITERLAPDDRIPPLHLLAIAFVGLVMWIAIIAIIEALR